MANRDIIQGWSLNFQGRGTFEIHLGPLRLEKELSVAEISDEVLLGADILQHDEDGPVDLILSRNLMICRGISIPEPFDKKRCMAYSPHSRLSWCTGRLHLTHDIINYECWSGFRTVVLKLVLKNVIILSGCSWVFFGKLLVVNWTPQSIISSECIRSYKTYKYHTGVRSWFRLKLERNLCDIWQSSWTHSYSRITHTPISLGHDIFWCQKC